MKGVNPFVPQGDDSGEIIGMKEELRILDGFLDQVGSGQSAMLLIHGIPGSGRSAFLRHLKKEAEKKGLFTVYTRIEDGEDIRDLAGRIFGEMSGPLARGKRPSDFSGLIPLICPPEGKKSFGNLLILDDIDALKKAEDSIHLIERAARASGKRIGIVMSSSKQIQHKDLPVLELKPIQIQEAHEFVSRVLKDSHVKMGEECINAILLDSGGNPKLFRNVCRLVYDRLKENEKVISKAHYLAYLPAIMSLLSIEWFGRAYQETPRAERDILSAMAKNEDGMHVSDISRKVGRPMGQVTALIGRLLDSGQIVRIERGKYKIFSRLYARYVMQRS
jgi:hypothetical protein